MATTKRKTASRTSTSRRRASTRGSGSSNSLLPGTESLTRSVSARPKTAAAIAAGLVTGIAAGIAGYLAFRRSGKSWEEFSNDVAASVKDSAASAGRRIKDGLTESRTRSQDMMDRRKDGLDEDKSQSEIAEEALTLKETGRKPKRPIDDTVATEIKAGAISY